MNKVGTNRGGSKWRLIGQAGVWAVASQLALRGINPAFPGVDEGHDLIINGGIRLQVKASHLMFQNAPMYKQGVYSFDLRRATFDPSKKSKQSSSIYRKYSEVADFFVLWGIDEDRFWIVPASIKNKRIYFPRRNSIEATKSGATVYWSNLAIQKAAAMENRWDLLELETISTLVEGASEVSTPQEI